MDIGQFAYKVIEKVKALPPEAKQSGSESDLETLWDQYLEQIQYEEYESFNLFEEMIEAMVRDMIDLEDDYNVEILHYFFNSERFKQAEASEKRNYVVKSVLDQIREIAGSEEIDYKKTIDYIQYRNDDIIDDPFIIVAEVLKKVGPSEYLVHAFSSATGPGGEQGIVNMTTLEAECELEIIDSHKYHLLKQCFHPTPSGRTRKDMPKRKREHSLRKHIPEMTKLSRKLRLKAEAMGQKPLQQKEESDKMKDDELKKEKDSDSLDE
jgi:hypothetical protein